MSKLKQMINKRENKHTMIYCLIGACHRTQDYKNSQKATLPPLFVTTNKYVLEKLERHGSCMLNTSHQSLVMTSNVRKVYRGRDGQICVLLLLFFAELAAKPKQRMKQNPKTA